MAVYLFYAKGDFPWLIVRECNGTIGRLEADFACFQSLTELSNR